MTGVLDEATETWTDLDEMLAAELPPCQITHWRPGKPKPAPCDQPSVTVLTLICSLCGPRRRACCAKHLRRLRRRQRVSAALRFKLDVCGYCGGDMTIGGLS